MTKRSIHGIYAAILAPRDERGELDEAALTRQLEFLLHRSIRNFAFNGATGEYCITSLDELRRILRVAKTTLPADAAFLCGIGSGRLHDTLLLGNAAMEAGAKALLAPMPHFFPYSQDDLSAFILSVASAMPAAPILLYNLPQFTSGLATATVLRLIEECGNIVGIKDSSGSLDILRALTRRKANCSRLIGNDGVLAQAVTEGLCDGVVSGVACVLPEVIQQLFANPPRSPSFQAAGERLKEFIAKIEILPTPWGLKAIAEARGIAPAAYQLPLAAGRAKQIDEIQSWFKQWIEKVAA